MKTKLFAILTLLVFATATHAANVSINDITIAPGTPTVEVPLLISPDDGAETIGAMNISFAAGTAGDAIPILNSGAEFDGSIWDNAGNFFGVPGTPDTHNAFSAVAMLNPLQISPDGTAITYTLDTSALAAGTSFSLDPNFEVNGVGTSADTSLSFNSGTLQVIPEPSTVALTAIFGVLGLGLAIKRRRS